eukprot:TRINITY_DN47054_c0_g1_i2.p1 TRINITY_DN47054_c0_g1~~TRINITY_DN47054_c0_g1_i2.p1  ORF type:complete len:103 (-),score=10.01 TRINITY_DN47054_c0_g1_i2:12-320(-)
MCCKSLIVAKGRAAVQMVTFVIVVEFDPHLTHFREEYREIYVYFENANLLWKLSLGTSDNLTQKFLKLFVQKLPLLTNCMADTTCLIWMQFAVLKWTVENPK